MSNIKYKPQPIAVLHEKIMFSVNNWSYDVVESINNATNSGQLDDNVVLKVNNAGIFYKFDHGCGEHTQTPFAIRDENGGKVYMHETFLSFVWIVCAMVIIIYDNKILPDINKYVRPDPYLLRQFDKLWEYSNQLLINKMRIKTWNKKRLLNPENYAAKRKSYIDYINAVYTLVASIIVFHEVSHVLLNHQNSTKVTEKEADDQAIKWVLSRSDIDEYRDYIEESVLSYVAVDFMISHSNVKNSHLDLQHRLDNAIIKLGNRVTEKTYLHACAIIAIWSKKTSFSLVMKQEYGDYEEMYKDFCNQMNEVSYRSKR